MSAISATLNPAPFSRRRCRVLTERQECTTANEAEAAVRGRSVGPILNEYYPTHMQDDRWMYNCQSFRSQKRISANFDE
jgi:hypothetical protein